MVDTCNLSLPLPSNYDIHVSRLDDTKYIHNSDNVLVCITGKIRNLKVSVYTDWITICGSLARFYYGANDRLLDRGDLKKAIDLLSDNLGVNLFNAKVKRLDFAGDIEILNPISNYFTFLSTKPHMRRNIVDIGTLHYSNTNRSIIFYDKTKEFNKGKELPNRLKRPVLRIEIRYYSNFIDPLINKTFGLHSLLIHMLLDREIYSFFIEQWQKEYFSINKEVVPLFNLSKESKPKEILDAITVQGIYNLGGLNSTLSIIDASRNNFIEIKPELIPRAKKYVRELIGRFSEMVPNRSVIELDNKVKEHTEKCLFWNSNLP